MSGEHLGGIDVHHKIGGISAGAWAGAIGGGVLIALWLRHRSSTAASADPGTVDATTADTTGTGGAAVSDPYATPGNPGNVTNPTGAGGTGSGAPIRNNNQWRQQMIKTMVGNGVSPLEAERAVHDFLAGKPLSEKEAKELNAAMAVVGPAPYPPPRSTVRHPAPKPAPPKHHPIAHKHDQPHHHHAHPQPPPHHRRDRGTGTNPGR